MSKAKRLGKIIRHSRKSQKLTQEQLAATTGVGVRFTRELELGKESSIFLRICNVIEERIKNINLAP